MRLISTWLTITLFFLAAISTTPARAQSPPLADLVSPDSVLAVVIHPADLLDQPMLELFPHEVLEAYGNEQLGVSLKQSNELLFVIEMDEQQRPLFGVIARFKQPQTFSGMFEEATKKKTVEGETYYQVGPAREDIAISFRGKQTMLFGHSRLISQLMQPRSKGGPLRKVLDKYPATQTVQVYAVLDPVRDLIKANLPTQNQVPPPFQGLLELPDLAEYAHMTVDLSDDFSVVTRFGGADEAAAKKMRRIQIQSEQNARMALMAQLANQIQQLSEPMQLAINQYADRVLTYANEQSEPDIEGNELVFRVKPDSGTVQIATIGILTGMLLPAVQQVRFASRRVQSMNKLRQLALATLNHESAFQYFPRQAIYSDDGKPLLSWRVKVLPFLEENVLYDQFHLDEPWDSPHNTKLLDRMPEVFKSPNADILNNKTVYLAFTGDQTLFPKSNPKEKIGLGKIHDGSSNTILFVEANQDAAVEWTKPADIPFDPDRDVTAVGRLIPDGFLAVFSDGSAHTISRSIDQENLKNLIMRNDGKVIDQSAFESR